MIHVCSPYRNDRNLGAAYNETFKYFNDEDWLCLTDWDVMFLTPDAINILHGYIERYGGDTGIFTCWTNRIHPGAKDQLYEGFVSENDAIKDHMSIAEFQKNKLYEVTQINKVISGFLMMIKKSTWNNIKFTENMRCLGVDNDYSKKILDSGRSILRMDGLYVFHNYRMKNGIKDKTHLL